MNMNRFQYAWPPIARTLGVAIFGLAILLSPTLNGTVSAAERPAKYLFGAKKLPAVLKAETFGFYNKGCLAGGIAMPVNGPNWQAMRLSRNRRWGHPILIKLLERLSVDAKKDGWNGLMVGDISQPRGGPMLSGHRSHQVGLDADIWLRPMPDRRLSRVEREKISAISMLKKGTVRINEQVWTRGRMLLLKRAANYSEVQRIFVHPAIKKKLCQTVGSDRAWLRKIRPYWGHHYHFHVRLHCQPGSPGCKKQLATKVGDGCDASLEWWFKVAFAPKKKPKKKAVKKKARKKTKKKRRRLTRLSDLPSSCRVVLNARGPKTLAEVTLNTPTFATSTTATATAFATASAKKIADVTPALEAIQKLTIPTPRPTN